MRATYGGDEVTDTKTDGELLVAFSEQHDEQAFQVVVQRHARLVMSVARTTIGNATDAEDVFQAVFVKLAQQARSLSREESVGGWLHTVTRRTALDAIKQTVRQQQRQQRYTTMNDTPATEEPPMELNDEQRRILFDEVARLPDRLRVPVILCFCEGLPQQAAARQAGCSQSTLSWRLSKASDLLRGSLARRGLRRPGAIGSCLAAAVGWVSVPDALVAQTVHNAGLLVGSTTATGGGLALLPPKVAQLVNANLGLGLSAKVGIAVIAAASIVGGVVLVDKLALRDTADGRSPGNAAVQPVVAGGQLDPRFGGVFFPEYAEIYATKGWILDHVPFEVGSIVYKFSADEMNTALHAAIPDADAKVVETEREGEKLPMLTWRVPDAGLRTVQWALPRELPDAWVMSQETTDINSRQPLTNDTTPFVSVGLDGSVPFLPAPSPQLGPAPTKPPRSGETGRNESSASDDSGARSPAQKTADKGTTAGPEVRKAPSRLSVVSVIHRHEVLLVGRTHEGEAIFENRVAEYLSGMEDRTKSSTNFWSTGRWESNRCELQKKSTVLRDVQIKRLDRIR